MATEDMDDYGFQRIIRSVGAIKRIKDSDYDIVTLSVGSKVARAGHIITTANEVYPAVDQAVTGDEYAYGIILEPLYPDDESNYTIDSTITDGVKVRVLKIGAGYRRGIQVAVFSEASQGAVVKGQQMVIGTSAGQVALWAYSDGSSETDTLEEICGYAGQDLADDGNHKIMIMDV